MNIHIPAQRSAPEQVAATAAPAPEAVELGWVGVLRTTVARASLAMVVSLVIWSVLPLLAGWTPRVIMSGSMEPRIHVGDIIVTRTVPGADVAKGQVITVKDPDHPAKTRTHRVLRRAADGTIVTKGDANPQADSSHITNDHVLGLGVVRVPFVGRPAYWMAEQNWLALGATTLFLGWCLVTVLPGSRKPEDTDGADTDDSDKPSTGSRPSRQARSSRPRRVAATVAVAAMAVGVAAGPADAAFKVTAANPTSSLGAAAHFYSYNNEVIGDSPYLYWRLDETSGTAISDASGNNRSGSLLAQTYAQNQTGALTSESPNRATGFTVASITGNNQVTPSGAFSVETWVKSTSTTGGRFLGFGDANGQNPSTKVDRQLYLAPNGRVYFGVGSAKTTVVSNSAINNGAWHHVVGTYTSGSNGMKLYVDGVLQGQATATVQTFAGYWRAGAEHIAGWAGNPSDDYFEGSLDEVAVYTDVLTPAEITSHYTNATS
jgi:signal peptidase I